MSHESFAGRQFFHGTNIVRADGILGEGAQPRDGWYGSAFYVTDNPEVSDRYADTASMEGIEGTVLRGSVEAKNPLVLDGIDGVTQYLGSPTRHWRLAQVARDAGHDFVRVGGNLSESLVLHPGGFRPEALTGDKGEDKKWTDLT